jgi:sulfhydrogenase subunit gamma (sulfur reductase)
MSADIYQPHLMRVEEVTDEAPDIRTLKLVFQDEAEGRKFDFRAGQFGLFSVFGEGESTFCIASPPTRKGYIECSFQKVGRVTRALRDLEVGDTVGFRGPYGNWFPLDEMKGKNIIFIGMGIGLAPVRCVIWNCLDLRDDFRDITIMVGSREGALLAYKREIKQWEEMSGVKLVKTVDPGGETPDWDGEVGFVPTVVEQIALSPENAVVVMCGPPIAIKFTLAALDNLGFNPEQIYTTLENKMKCGLGKCGRCNVGNVYVCKDGPVFTAAQLRSLPQEF